MPETLEQYQARVKQRLAELLPIFAHASIGDFNQDVKIPAAADEFTDLYVGLQIMIEVVREQTKQLQTLNQRLEQTLSERTAALYRELEETAKHEAILDSIGEGLIVTDKTTKIILANTRATEILGLKDGAQIKGKVHAQIFHLINEQGQTLPVSEYPLSRALKEGGRIVATDLWYRRPDNTTFPLTITASPVMSGGKIVGAVKVFRDMTIEKNIERSKTEFVLLASHQLRTPVSIIKWYGQLLAKELGERNAKQKQYLVEIDEGTKRMNEVIGTLLDVAQIESGLLKYEPESMSIVPYINRLLEDLGPRIKQKQVKIIKKFAANLPQLQTDPKLLRMVLQNLLTNAIKYMDSGGRITLVIKNLKAGAVFNGKQTAGTSLGISISDNGYGIPPDQQNRIFSKMFRAANVKDKIEGTGIGLFITKSVVDFLGGQIWFDSQVGKGTNFYILLPLRVDAQK